ncbi:MAG: hypothetical protein M3R63_01505 [Actinomycetota bacterium]|nr:hypothetical protein [Actinomycetota bacterium]
MTSTTETVQQRGCEAPGVVALWRQEGDGEEEVAGWAMVLADRVVAYVPDRVGVGAMLSTFSSMNSAERVLAYADIYVGD